MRLADGYLPIGKLPYNNIKLITAMQAKLYRNFPFMAFLPLVSEEDTLEKRTFDNIPGVIFKDGKVTMKTGSEKYEKEMAELDKAFKNPSKKNLEKYKFDTPFSEKFEQMLHKFKPQNACVNILGPFTVSQILFKTIQEQSLTDKNFKKLFVKAVCIKGLWAINKIKHYSPNTVPVIILEEPMLGQFGMVKRENDEITPETVINLFSRVSEKLKSAGAIVGVQCMEKCDWSLPIRGGVDLISYDAYNNPNNLSIIPEILTSFLQKGGIINWGIVPVLSESILKGLTIDYLVKRLTATMSGVTLSGVPAGLLYQSAMVSLNGDTNHLPILFAEKAMILSRQLASRLNSEVDILNNAPVVN